MAEQKDTTISILLKLTVISVIAALALTLTYGVTQEQLRANQKGSSMVLLEAGVVPGAVSFKAVMADGEELYDEAYDGSNTLIGYAFTGDIEGYQEPITIAGGMDLDFKMTGLKIISQKETPGIGDKIQKQPEFAEEFKGVGLDGLALSSDGGEIDAITGATMSSAAVVEGVHGVVEKIQKEVS